MKMMVALVGMEHRSPAEQAVFASLPHGEPLTLVREPTNRYDPKAVQVWARGQHVGYLKGSQNRDISIRMDIKLGMDSAATFEAKLALEGGKWPLVEID